MRRISLNALFAAFLPPAIGTGLMFGGIFSVCDGYFNYWSKLSTQLKFSPSRGFHRSARRRVSKA